MNGEFEPLLMQEFRNAKCIIRKNSVNSVPSWPANSVFSVVKISFFTTEVTEDTKQIPACDT